MEELLRVVAPTSVPRAVTRDTQLAGVQMRNASKALLVFPSANRDACLLDHPDEVVLDREPNRHQAFGHGLHACLGAPLARMEVLVGVQESLRRIPEFKVLDLNDVTWKPGPIRGPSCLPLVLRRR